MREGPLPSVFCFCITPTAHTHAHTHTHARHTHTGEFFFVFFPVWYQSGAEEPGGTEGWSRKNEHASAAGVTVRELQCCRHKGLEGQPFTSQFQHAEKFFSFSTVVRLLQRVVVAVQK